MEKRDDHARGRSLHAVWIPLGVLKRYERLLRSGGLRNCSAFVTPQLEDDTGQAYKPLTMHMHTTVKEPPNRLLLP